MTVSAYLRQGPTDPFNSFRSNLKSNKQYLNLLDSDLNLDLHQIVLIHRY